MEPAVDTVLEFHDNELRDLMQKEEGLPDRLNSWFASRPITGDRKHDFTTLRKMARRSGGKISVESLAAVAHVSNRTLERIFKENVGIPPKEFLRIIRFQEVLRQLRQTGHSANHQGAPFPFSDRLLLGGLLFDLISAD